jgi:predicted RNA-binding protein YlqC (UPF0109 family)
MIEALARALVDHPEQVRVESEDDRGSTVVMLHVADEDLGQVIGRGGRIARSLRVVLRASATAQGRRAVLEIVD